MVLFFFLCEGKGRILKMWSQALWKRIDGGAILREQNWGLIKTNRIHPKNRGISWPRRITELPGTSEYSVSHPVSS